MITKPARTRFTNQRLNTEPPQSMGGTLNTESTTTEYIALEQTAAYVSAEEVKSISSVPILRPRLCCYKSTKTVCEWLPNLYNASSQRKKPNQLNTLQFRAYDSQFCHKPEDKFSHLKRGLFYF